MTTKTVDVIIPVYRPDGKLYRLINRLNRQTIKPSVILLIVSIDADEAVPACGYHSVVGFAQTPLCNIQTPSAYDNVYCLYIPVSEYDHALTRQIGTWHTDSSYILFMTQDALPKDRRLIQNLLSGMHHNENIAVSYARQLPENSAADVEKFIHFYNYPKVSADKSLSDLHSLGIHTYFCSNACAMYHRNVFEALGGFDKSAIFNEDMVYAAKAIRHLYHISYNASAQVIHSHSYSLKKQFSRYFDNGVSQAMHPEIFSNLSSEKSGMNMLLCAVVTLFLKKQSLLGFFHNMTELLAVSFMKLIGFRLGKNYRRLPKSLIKKLSLNQNWWDIP